MVFELNKVYNYTTLVPEILGGSYTSMKVKMIMTADQAVKLRDIHTIHKNLSSVIVGLPTDINDCTFILFEDNDEARTKHVIALEYLDEFSIALVETNNVRIDVFDTDTNMVSVLRTRLTELGISNFKITTF